MKFYAHLVIFLFLFLNISSATENYINYHKAVINCEREFLFNNNVPAAITGYKKVFKEYKKPFAKDCFIALQLACSVGDRASAKEFFHLAAENGMEWDAMSGSKALQEMLGKDKVFKSELQSLYKQDSTKFWKTLSLQLREEVFAMKHRDDSFKMRGQGFAKDDPVRIQRHSEHLAVIDSNTLRIAELTKRHGFLGDRLVGYMSSDVEYHGKDGISFYTNYIYTLIDQLYYHHGCCYFLTAKELEEELQDGNILPSMYACFYEWAYKDLKEHRPEMGLCNPANTVQEKYYNICPVVYPWDRHKDLAFVNKCREEIGMASLEHYTRKKEYEKETGMVLFFGMFSIN